MKKINSTVENAPKNYYSTMAPLNPHPIIILMGFKMQLIAIDSVMGKG